MAVQKPVRNVVGLQFCSNSCYTCTPSLKLFYCRVSPSLPIMDRPYIDIDCTPRATLIWLPMVALHNYIYWYTVVLRYQIDIQKHLQIQFATRSQQHTELFSSLHVPSSDNHWLPNIERMPKSSVLHAMAYIHMLGNIPVKRNHGIYMYT